jgi:hypothetical protein
MRSPQETEAGSVWLQDPITIQQRRFFEDELDSARVNLHSACERSVDPSVRAAYAVVCTLELALERVSLGEETDA